MTISVITILGTLIIGIIGLLISEPSFLVKLVLVIIMIVTSGATLYERYSILKEEKYSKSFGKFYFPLDSENDIELRIAGNIFRDAQKVSNQFGNDKFEAWKENGQLYLNLTVRDFNGDIVFYINGNEWKNISGTEFNFDKTGMEIKDKKGKIILQIEFNPENNSLDFFGLSYFGPNQLFWAGQSENGGQSLLITPNNLDELIPLTPKFKYPMENNKGIRVTQT